MVESYCSTLGLTPLLGGMRIVLEECHKARMKKQIAGGFITTMNTYPMEHLLLVSCWHIHIVPIVRHLIWGEISKYFCEKYYNTGPTL